MCRTNILITMKGICYLGLLLLAWDSQPVWYVPVTWIIMVIGLESLFYWYSKKKRNKK